MTPRFRYKLATLVIMLTALLLVNIGCYVHSEDAVARLNPINAPDIRFIYNTNELAGWNGLERDKCGATERAFRTYVCHFTKEQGWDVDKVEYIYGTVLGEHECIRYAVVYLKDK